MPVNKILLELSASRFCSDLQMWVWVKINHQDTAGFGPCSYFAGFHFGYIFLTHSKCLRSSHEDHAHSRLVRGIWPWARPGFVANCGGTGVLMDHVEGTMRSVFVFTPKVGKMRMEPVIPGVCSDTEMLQL